jgi:hypothetical protein
VRVIGARIFFELMNNGSTPVTVKFETEGGGAGYDAGDGIILPPSEVV